MGATILAIDDSPEVLKVLAARLRADGHRVLTATSGARGLRTALAVVPDLVLLDIEMPGASGFDVCRQLKADPITSLIPVIFLTGHTDVNVKIHGFDLGAVDYVTKPFHAAELRARVRAALRVKEAQDTLRERGDTDSLTGLRNRRWFDQQLKARVELSLARKAPTALVLLDIDHFKRINDERGHPAGDVVLQRLSAILRSTVRPSDEACRYGGEEFAIIVDGNALAGARVAERLSEALRTTDFGAEGSPLAVTISCGVAEILDVTAQLERADACALVDAADAALYAAKRGGRDRVCSFPEGFGTKAA